MSGDAFLGLFNSSLYAAPGGNGSTLVSSLSTRISGSGLLRHFPTGLASDSNAPPSPPGNSQTNSWIFPSEWRGPMECRASASKVQTCFTYERPPIVPGGNLLFDDEHWSQDQPRYRYPTSGQLYEQPRCTVALGADFQWPRYDLEERVLPPMRKVCLHASMPHTRCLLPLSPARSLVWT